MPTPAKATSAMTKHMTKAEQDARTAAENGVALDRAEVVLKKPPWLTGRGKKYWDQILVRMQGTVILDDLDTEMLAIYCAQLQERDALQADLKAARNPKDGEPDMELILSITKQLNAKDSKIRDFANDLGCTPSGRVRLAAKRASQADEVDPYGDLFGD